MGGKREAAGGQSQTDAESDAELAMRLQEEEECRQAHNREVEQRAEGGHQAQEIDRALDGELMQCGSSSGWNQGRADGNAQERGHNLAASVVRREPDRLPGFAPPTGTNSAEGALEWIRQSAVTGVPMSAADHNAAPWMQKESTGP